MATCAGVRCIEHHIEYIWVGPNNEDLCQLCAVHAWDAYKNQLRKSMCLAPVTSKGASDFIQKRKTGVMIVYPGSYTQPVRSMWTPTRCYPYPNYRARFGLQKSYPTDLCKVQEASK